MTQALKRFPDIKVFERGMDGWAFILLGENELQINALTQEL